jgi:hypothetical protein
MNINTGHHKDQPRPSNGLRALEWVLNGLMVFAIAYTVFWVVYGNLDANATKPATYHFANSI